MKHIIEKNRKGLNSKITIIERDYEEENKNHYIDQMTIRMKVKDQDLVKKVYHLET